MYIAFVGKNCITDAKEFGAVCLAEVVLRVALVPINDLRDGGAQSEEIKNKRVIIIQYTPIKWDSQGTIKIGPT